MVVLPCDTGTSRPLSSIPATSGSSEVHLSFLFVAFSGRIAGANRKAPTPGSAAKSNVLDVASSVRLSMGMLLSTSSIVRRIASLTCMSLASAVSVTSPKASAVTRPLLSTVATLVLELYQAILRLVASAGFDRDRKLVRLAGVEVQFPNVDAYFLDMDECAPRRLCSRSGRQRRRRSEKRKEVFSYFRVCLLVACGG